MVASGFILLILLAFASAAMGYQMPEQPGLPNFDLRDVAKENAPNAGRDEAVLHLKAAVQDVKIGWDELLGTPKMISSTRTFLSGPDGMGGGISRKAAEAFPKGDPHRAVKAFLNDHAALFGHGAEVLNKARVERDFIAPHNSLRTIVWAQEFDEVSVFESVLIGHITKRGELVNLSSRLLPDAAAAARNGMPNHLRMLKGPDVTAASAVSIAANLIGENTVPKDFAALESQPAGAELRCSLTAPVLRESARARLVWLPMDCNRMRLCWEIILTGRAHNERYRVLIDAETGRALLRHCLTNYISDASYRVFTSDSPSPMSPGLPVPLTNQPPFVSRELVVTKAISTNASPNGWINDGDNETRGNNVDAHLDIDANNLPDLPRPQGSPTRVFDFLLDLTQPPSANRNAAVVQLFYWCNWMHDKLYELGFTEAAGNFQNNNFGRGGTGNDAVQADAQDGSGFNNANFSVDNDGIPGRMQMYTFTAPVPDRDGCFDAEVVLHEYTHGLSNRRVGGGIGISALQSVGMGEGWSDFYALALLSSADDDPQGNYSLGAYSTKDFLAEENYYFGFRRYPYSILLTKNPLTFKDVDPTQIDSHAGIPKNPSILSGASEVHNQGEVWCAMLWDARAHMINKHGFTNGNHLILQLVTDGMNLSPPNPTFIEARDAILQADQILTGGTNKNELWAAFAKRGLGFLATAPANLTTIGVVEDYNVPDDFEIKPVADFVLIGEVGGSFIPAFKTYSLTNRGTASIHWSAKTDAALALSSTNGSLAPGAATSVTISASATASSLPAGIYPVIITFSNATSGLAQTRKVILRVGQPDSYTTIFDAKDFNLAFTTFTFTPNATTSFYGVCRQPAVAFPTDPSGGTPVTLGDDTYLPASLSGGAEVFIYGQHSSSFYIGANGHLTLTAGHFDFFYPDLSIYFERARISPLYTDLDPSSSGGVSWKQLADRVAVTYLAVPEFGQQNTNNFQVEMFFNGIIRITWLKIDANSAVVGLSKGAGLPGNFLESDPSNYPTCTGQPPRLQIDRIGKNVRLAWPLGTTSLHLESASNLVPPVSWSSVNGAVQFTNGFNAVTLQGTNSKRFYRLVTP